VRKITIAFTAPHKKLIGSELIKLWTSSEYSHVAIIFKAESLNNEELVYHAAHGMVHFLSGVNFKKHNNIVSAYDIELTDQQYKYIMLKCIRLAGQPYGYLELAKIVISDIARELGINYTPSNGRGYICSELLGTLLITLGVNFNKPLHLLSPKDIEKGLLANGYIKI
jgi:hypothetical protein